MPVIQDKNNVYGVDIAFQNGRYALTAKGDYQTITGEENLRRSIWRRLITNPGEYKLDPSYGVGVPAFVKKGLTNNNLSKLRHRITDNLSRDPRIEKILELTLTPAETSLTIVLRIQAKGKAVTFQPFTFRREA